MTTPVPAAISREELGAAYAAALEAFLHGAGEEALARVYELARRAASGGFGVVDMAMLHHEALHRLLAHEPSVDPAVYRSAGQCLAESLSPFEMTLRAYQANARLLGLGETLARQNTEIDRAREQLQTILDATTAVIYLKDVEGRFLYVNRQFEQLFGTGRDDVIGRLELEALSRHIAAAFGARDSAVMESGRPDEVEEIIPLADGPHTYLSLKFPLRDGHGAIYGLCCVATDITERKRADERLRRAKEATEAANRELESFSYSVAHDLRAPLRRINGFSHILLRNHGASLSPDAQKLLDRVLETTGHMSHLIDDLLGLARLSRAELRRQPVDLSAMAAGIVERLRAGEPARDVSVEIAPGLSATGDRNLLQAALENLLGNAWKFTGRSTPARIELGASGGPPTAFFVRDNGAGFDMQYVDKLFGVFQRLHSQSEFEGTGVGLATVQRIVARHGGRIWAEAAVGQGATFFFTLEGSEQ